MQNAKDILIAIGGKSVPVQADDFGSEESKETHPNRGRRLY